MSNEINKLTPLHAQVRGRGDRMTAKERKTAKEEFLKAYTLNGNIMLSCRRANVSRSTIYIWLEKDTDFSILYNQATKDFADLALAEFTKRAMQGYEKPLVSMGKLVYDEKGKPMTERVVSDNLLAMLIKRHFPEYRDKTATVAVELPKEYVNLPEDGVTE